MLLTYEYPNNPARSFSFLHDITIFGFLFEMHATLFAIFLSSFFFFSRIES